MHDGTGNPHGKNALLFKRSPPETLWEYEVLILSQALKLRNIRTHQWHVLQCSAMTGKNLKEGLAWVVDEAKKRLFLY